MIIECPVCPKPAPRYKIDAALIGDEGRDVRCPRCGHEWFVTPEDFARFAKAQGQDRHNAHAPQNAPAPRNANGGLEAESFPGGAQYDADVHGEAYGEAYGGMRADAPQIVGATFSCEPPYDDADEGAPMDDRAFAPDPAPRKAPDGVSAGAALAIAAASSSDETADAGRTADAPGGPHVPSTAAEIASAFFASSFEEPEEDAPDDALDRPQTSFSLWSALDSVRPDDNYASETPPDSEPREEAREARTAFHATAPQTHGNPAHKDPAHRDHAHGDLVDDHLDFREADDFDRPPAYETHDDEDALPSGDSFWGRTLQGGNDDNSDDAGNSAYEPAYKLADAAPDGGEERDDELAAALASAANWDHNDLSSEAASSEGGDAQRREEALAPSPRLSAEENWDPAPAPAPQPSEITRLVQALNGRDAAKSAAQEFAAQEYAAQEYAAQEHAAQRYSAKEFNEDVPPETSQESAWPAERMVHIEDFRRGGGWQATDLSDDASASLKPNASTAGDRDGAARQAPSFLRARHDAQERDDLRGQPDRAPARSMHTHPDEIDYEVEEDYAGDYEEVIAASQPRRMGGLAVAASWGVFLTIVAGLGGAAIHFREGVVDRLPGTARLYQVLHMPVASRDVKLDFANVTYRWAMRDEQPMIAIEGDIVSRSNAVERVPLVVVAVHDPERSSPARRFEDVQIEQVEPNGSAHFTLDVTAPPKGVNEIALEFKK